MLRYQVTSLKVLMTFLLSPWRFQQRNKATNVMLSVPKFQNSVQLFCAKTFSFLQKLLMTVRQLFADNFSILYYFQLYASLNPYHVCLKIVSRLGDIDGVPRRSQPCVETKQAWPWATPCMASGTRSCQSRQDIFFRILIHLWDWDQYFQNPNHIFRRGLRQLKSQSLS